MNTHLGANGTDEFTWLNFGEEEWKEDFELGVTTMKVTGDPSKPGIYVLRINWPPNVMSLPHVHPEDRHVTVLAGTWYAGTSETFDPSTAVGMAAGSHMFHPAGAMHWDGAKSEGAIIEIVGYGPTGMNLAVPTPNHFTRI